MRISSAGGEAEVIIRPWRVSRRTNESESVEHPSTQVGAGQADDNDP